MKAEACPRAIDTDRVETPRSFVTSRRVGGARRHEPVFQRVRRSRASGGVGTDLVRWAIWLAIASFAAGRFSSFRPLPETVATLPGDESEFSREFDDRVRERFPIGSSEDQLLTFLANEGFSRLAESRQSECELLRSERTHMPENRSCVLARRRRWGPHGRLRLR